MAECDFLVVGARIAGASAAWTLAEHGSVIVVERETSAGYHTTGDPPPSSSSPAVT